MSPLGEIVAAYRTCGDVVVSTVRENIPTFGNPLLKAVHVFPPSMDWLTPNIDA
jgi:hypothetical protein